MPALPSTGMPSRWEPLQSPREEEAGRVQPRCVPGHRSRRGPAGRMSAGIRPLATASRRVAALGKNRAAISGGLARPCRGSQSALLAFLFHVGMNAAADEILVVVQPLPPAGAESGIVADDRPDRVLDEIEVETRVKGPVVQALEIRFSSICRKSSVIRAIADSMTLVLVPSRTIGRVEVISRFHSHRLVAQKFVTCHQDDCLCPVVQSEREPSSCKVQR